MYALHQALEALLSFRASPNAVDTGPQTCFARARDLRAAIPSSAKATDGSRPLHVAASRGHQDQRKAPSVPTHRPLRSSFLESYKVIPKRNYLGAYGQRDFRTLKGCGVP